MSPPLIEIGGKQKTGEPPHLRRQPPPKPAGPRPPRPAPPAGPAELDTVHVEVELPLEPTQAIVVRPPRAASRPDDDGDPFVTYRLDKLDRAVEKLDDDGTRVESKVDSLAVKVDELSGAVKRGADRETSRKAFWSFMTVAITVAGTMFANYMSKPTPATPASNVVVSEFERKLDEECRSKPVDQVACFARVYAETKGARAH